MHAEDEHFPAYNCPSCGGPIELHFRYTKMMNCPHCNTGLFLEDEAVKLSGIQSVLAEHPSLIKLFSAFAYRGKEYMPVGRARFEYEPGAFWDEWWVIINGDMGQGHWLSVDEGDYALEMPFQITGHLDVSGLSIGSDLNIHNENLIVTEIGHATCIGFEGELPERFQVGDNYDYYHLSGRKGRLITLEIKNQQLLATEGFWIDPFEIKVL